MTPWPLMTPDPTVTPSPLPMPAVTWTPAPAAPSRVTKKRFIREPTVRSGLGCALSRLGRRTHRPPRHWQSPLQRPAPPPRRCSSPAPCLPRRAAFSAHPEIRLPLFCLETFFETATAISREGGPAKFLMWWKVWPSVTGGGDESSVVAMTKPGSCAARPNRFRAGNGRGYVRVARTFCCRTAIIEGRHGASLVQDATC